MYIYLNAFVGKTLSITKCHSNSTRDTTIATIDMPSQMICANVMKCIAPATNHNSNG